MRAARLALLALVCCSCATTSVELPDGSTLTSRAFVAGSSTVCWRTPSGHVHCVTTKAEYSVSGELVSALGFFGRLLTGAGRLLSGG